MHNIILRDNRNKRYDKILFLTENLEKLITDNIIKMNRSGYELNINDVDLPDVDSSIEDLEKQGFKPEQALYDKLIIEYNHNNKDLLKMWR